MLDYFGLPYTRLRNETVRAGDLLSVVDVVILPSVSARALRVGRGDGTVFSEYAGGLDPDGSVALEEFVKSGGTLIACERSGEYVVELFDLPVKDVTRVGRLAKPAEKKDHFQCAGSILRTVPRRGARWTLGLSASQPIFFSHSRAYELTDEGKASEKTGALQTLLEFPESRILLSGWSRKPETLAASAAWIRFDIGDGQVHLFGFRPQYRSWTQTTFRLLMRAILLPRE